MNIFNQENIDEIPKKFIEMNIKILKNYEERTKDIQKKTMINYSNKIRKQDCLSLRFIIENPDKILLTNLGFTPKILNMIGLQKIDWDSMYLDYLLEKCGHYIALIRNRGMYQRIRDFHEKKAIFNDPSSIKYMNNPSEENIMIVAAYAPEYLSLVNVDIPQKVQDYLIEYDPESIKYLPNPTLETAIKLVKRSPFMVKHLPAAMKNHPKVISALTTSHFLAFQDNRLLKKLSEHEDIKIPKQVFKTLTFFIDNIIE